MAAVDAVYPASRNAMAFPHLVLDEGLEPHNVDIVYMFFTDQADTWVDISDTIEIKIASLREHTSQLREPEKLEEMLRSWSSEDGQKIGAAAAESFRLLKMNG